MTVQDDGGLARRRVSPLRFRVLLSPLQAVWWGGSMLDEPIGQSLG